MLISKHDLSPLPFLLLEWMDRRQVHPGLSQVENKPRISPGFPHSRLSIIIVRLWTDKLMANDKKNKARLSSPGHERKKAPEKWKIRKEKRNQKQFIIDHEFLSSSSIPCPARCQISPKGIKIDTTPRKRK